MYGATDLLARIDDHAVLIMAGFGLAMVFQTIWMVDALRVARIEKRYSMPLFCTFFWLAHDSGCVARFDEWFNVHDHWYMKLYWVGLLSAVCWELLYLSQVVRYGREEIMPWASPWVFLLILGAGVVTSVVTWEFIKTGFADPLYQASPVITQVSYPVFGLMMLLGRRSAIGQTPRMWWSFTGMCVAFVPTSVVFFGPYFQTWQYVASGVVAIVGGAVMAIVVARMRRAAGLGSPSATAGSRVATSVAAASSV